MDPDAFDAASVRSSIVDSAVLRLLRSLMPPVIQRQPKGLQWKMLFNMAVHGASLESMYTQLEAGNRNTPPYLLIISDAGGSTFGAYVASPLEKKPNKYYGTGECFLFTIKPEIRHYPWTGRNSYFINSSAECIALGGGGKFSLHVDEDLNHGSSGQSETFDNPCLASGEDFTCIDFQVWGVCRRESGDGDEDGLR